MSNTAETDLCDWTDYHVAVATRPARPAQTVMLLLLAVFGSAVLWAHLTEANEVIRAPGRIRSTKDSRPVVFTGRGELFASGGGVVVEVIHREGDVVSRGAVMLRLDTEHLDHEIRKRRHTITSMERELINLASSEDAELQQFQAAKNKVLADLAQAEEELRHAKDRRSVQVRLAELFEETMADEAARARAVNATKSIAAQDVIRVMNQFREAQEKVRLAQLPVDKTKVDVVHRGLLLLEKEQMVRKAERKHRYQVKEGELQASKIELDGLCSERKSAVVCAPIDGVVTSGKVKVGDILVPGKVVMEITELEDLCFEAVVPSRDMADLQVGMPARVRVDAYDYQKYGTAIGQICEISPDSAVSETQRATVYLVRIRLDKAEVRRGEWRGPVGLGMAGTAEIVTGKESLLSRFFRGFRRSISLG